MSSLHDLDPHKELSLVPGFAELTPDALTELALHAVQRRVPVRELVVEQGQVAPGLVFLVRGAIKSARTTATSEGRETRVLDVLRAPAMVPDTSAFDGLPAEASVVAIRACHVFVVERRVLQKLLGLHPTLERVILARFLRECRSQVRRFDELASGSVEERIHRLLEALARDHGTPLGHGRFIPLPLRRSDLASMGNATTETVSRLLAKLEREGRARSTRDGIWWRGHSKRGAAAVEVEKERGSTPPPHAKAVDS